MIDAIAIDVKNRILDYEKNFWANRNNYPPEPMLRMEDLAARHPGADEATLLKGLSLGFQLAGEVFGARTAKENSNDSGQPESLPTL